MKRSIAFFTIAMAALFTACSNSADKYEIERLRAENEALKASATVSEAEEFTAQNPVTTQMTTTEAVTESKEDLVMTIRKELNHYFTDVSEVSFVTYDEDSNTYICNLTYDGSVPSDVDWWHKKCQSVKECYDDAKKYLRKEDRSSKISLELKTADDELLYSLDENGKETFNILGEKMEVYNKKMVTIDSGVLTNDYKGEAAIIIEFTFNNNAFDDSRSFLTTFNAQAFQDGIELERAYFINDDEYDASEQMLDVQPGASLTVHVGYKLRNETSDVKVTVGEFFGDTVYARTTFGIS